MRSSKTQKSRVSIRDVAEIAGVSISTVSRALTGHRGVSDQTRSRIMSIANDVGYQASAAARSLRTSSSMTLAMLTPDLENPISQAQMRAAVCTAAIHGYSMIVFESSAGANQVLPVIQRIRESDVNGLLLGAVRLPVNQELLDLLDSGMVVESTVDPTRFDDDADFIVDHAAWLQYERAACTHAGRRLFGLGHQHVAYLGWRDQSLLGRSRLQAFVDCAAGAGLPATAIKVLQAGKKEDAFGLVQHVLANAPTPTALISASGLMTPYILEGIRSARVSIPEELSFLTFGDSPWHRAMQPALSVIRRDIEAEATGLVERLIARIEGREVPELEFSPTEFIDRGSIAAPPQVTPKPEAGIK